MPAPHPICFPRFQYHTKYRFQWPLLTHVPSPLWLLTNTLEPSSSQAAAATTLSKYGIWTQWISNYALQKNTSLFQDIRSALFHFRRTKMPQCSCAAVPTTKLGFISEMAPRWIRRFVEICISKTWPTQKAMWPLSPEACSTRRTQSSFLLQVLMAASDSGTSMQSWLAWTRTFHKETY